VDKDSFLIIELFLEANGFGENLAGFLLVPLFKDDPAPIPVPIYLGTKNDLQNVRHENFRL
jgi:hypothetical protein